MPHDRAVRRCPRGPATLNADERESWAGLVRDRNSFANLVLMSGVHHDVIDTDLSHYTAERVVAIKRAHEAKILASRPAAQQQRDAIELRYAAIVDVWATRISLDSWEGLMTRGG